MKRRIFKTFLMFAIFLLFSVLFREDARTGSNEFELKVDEEGNLSWESIVDKAQNKIRWRTQGFNFLIHKTKLGYPFGEDNRDEQIHIRIRNDGENVEVSGKEIAGDKLRVTYRIKGEKIRNEILKRKDFYDALIKKIKENKEAKIYINQYFETYLVVTEEGIRDEVIDAFKNKTKKQYQKQFKDGYFQYRGREYYYDTTVGAVMQIRRKNLHNIRQIRMAESWGNKNEWNSIEYYNYPVNYKLSSNVLVGIVGVKDELLGDKWGGKERKKLSLLFREKEIFDGNMKKIEVEGKETLNPRLGFKMKVDEKVEASLGEVYPKIFIENKKKYVGDKVKLIFPEKITRKNKKVTYHFKACYMLKGRKKIYLIGKYDKKKNYVVELELGIELKKIYGVYEKKDKDKKIEEDMMEGEGIALPEGRIGAGNLEESEFDIVEGIPVTEEYYEQVRTENYILNYRFKKKTGMKDYIAKSRIEWNLYWTETVGSGKEQKTVTGNRQVTRTYHTPIKRKFSYWVIDKLEYYTLDGAVIENEALAENGIKILQRNCIFPHIDLSHDTGEERHIEKPIELGTSIFLGSKTSFGRTVPYYNPQHEVDYRIGKIRVRNDKMRMDGNVIMDDSWREEETEKPKEPKTEGEVCGEKSLYRDGKKIKYEIQNGVYDSSGRVLYKLEKSINPENEGFLEYEIEEINSVRVHTPVICDYRMEDAKEWCQLVEPNFSLYQLVLTKEFELDILTEGEHLPIKGYGRREFQKYVKKKEAIFPFEVLLNGQIYPEGHPIPFYGKMKFRVPEYVKEGRYEIKLRVLALNSEKEEEKEENYANLEMENYVAVNSVFVEVSGRMIHFTLENIKNTSLWKEVFLDGPFKQGLPLKELPLINGNHPLYKNIGDFKKGYAMEIGITTIGEYYDEEYGIRMDFEFYVTDEAYKDKRKVDVYYEAVSEKDGKKLGLVRVGSDKDKENLHFYKKEGRNIPLFTYERLLFPRELLAPGSDRKIQRWRGEYCIPARLHVCEEGYPIEEYLKKNMAFYFDENFWIRKGKLILKANIYAMKRGKKFLDYINEKNAGMGFLNNWRYETRGRKKYYLKDEILTFQDGEVFVYDIAKSIWLERRSEVKKGY